MPTRQQSFFIIELLISSIHFEVNLDYTFIPIGKKGAKYYFSIHSSWKNMYPLLSMIDGKLDQNDVKLSMAQVTGERLSPPNNCCFKGVLFT